MTHIFSSLLFIICILTVAIILLKNPKYKKLIIICFFLRCVAILFNLSIFPLPDSQGDAFNFEWHAWDWASKGAGTVMDEIITSGHGRSWFYASFISYIYLFTGRNYFIILFFNLVFSLLTFHWLVKIFNELGYNNIQKKIGLSIYTFFPALINYAAVSLREIYTIFLLTIIVFFLIKWLRKFEFKYFIILCILFYINNYLHEALFTGILLIVAIQFFIYLKKIIFSINLKNSLTASLILILMLSIFIRYQESIPYFNMLIEVNPKTFQGTDQCKIIAGCQNNNQEFLTALSNKMKISHFGDSSYPNYLIPQNNSEVLFLTPIRILYFYIGPFLWNVKKITHIMLFFDGLFYLCFILLILINIKNIIKNKSLLIILLLLIIYSILFSVGISNSGSAYRHRTKFTILFIILIIPYLEKIIINISEWLTLNKNKKHGN